VFCLVSETEDTEKSYAAIKRVIACQVVVMAELNFYAEVNAAVGRLRSDPFMNPLFIVLIRNSS